MCGNCIYRASRSGFSLIELMVVAAIVGLLVSILVPSLASARYQTRLAVCKSNLHQIGTGISTYAVVQKVIPHGPEVQALPPFLEPNDGKLATSQIWTGPQQPMKAKMALGLLLAGDMVQAEVLYCPGDDSNDPVEELPKITMQKISPGYCSYLYRQLDQTEGMGRIEKLGKNEAGRSAVALALDMNSLITFDPSYARTNHKARRVNVLYVDGAVRQFDNIRNSATGEDPFSIRDSDFLADGAVSRRDRIIQKADLGYWKDVSNR